MKNQGKGNWLEIKKDIADRQKIMSCPNFPLLLRSGNVGILIDYMSKQKKKKKRKTKTKQNKAKKDPKKRTRQH